MYDTILKNLEIPNTWANLISVDLEKACDYVDHNVLLDILSHEFQMDPSLVKIISLFLSQRSQVVKCMKPYSEPLPVYNGIPQGSIIGPILFSVMVNNLAEDIPIRWKFVDDMTLLEVARKKIKN
jgi:retron-type reverse transcriptase